MKILFLVLGALVAQPVLAADAVAPLSPGSHWTGFHAGIQIGRMDNALAYQGRTFLSGGTDSWGLHAGYAHDFGPHVLGAEADFNRFRGGNGDLLRLKGKAGVDLGRYQPYLVMGLARLSGDGLTEAAPLFGVGGDWKVTDRLTIGIEYTYQEFDDVLADETGVAGYDLDMELAHLRAS
ncbi:outer membrane protein [Paracoccus shandongensis]|uniref:outer membrane protein n=1 Tax=Paracoccus shandongensis TaxID=2816048 RepID=UPI001A8E2EF6|nr:porin family protein [Paracoccus shandongensis]